MEDEPSSRRFYLVSHEEDIPNSGAGTLIPLTRKKLTVPVEKNRYLTILLIPVAILVFVLSVSLVGFESLSSKNTASVSQLTVTNEVVEVKPLNYGVEVTLAQPNFFVETRDALIDAEKTFIEADLVAMKLLYFEKGVLVESMDIKAKGKEGSWWETPSGLYKIEFKKENHFSSFGQVNQPWSMAFQGNFFIHGWPSYPDGEDVPEGFSGGCIRLENEDAKRLFELVEVGTPVLVHEQKANDDSQFVYEPKVPELKTPHYLIADVESSTVLAASDLTAVASIASVGKLMTTLVAAEFINLDNNVSVTQPTFVQSLVPRLGERKKVSMYSLLQLLLVESSNEAAEVIAAQLGRDNFIEKMNQKALSLGMVNTHFADPSGLSAENVSTLSDLLRLAQYIYSNRSFILELTANQNLKTAYTGGEFGELLNFNKVEELDNFIGGKVGETIAAGQTSVTLHRLKVKGKERTLAIIILGSENRNADVTELLHYAEERFGS